MKKLNVLMIVCVLVVGGFFRVSWAAGGLASDGVEMEKWWADLEKGEPMSSLALLRFSGKPEASVAFLKLKMRAVKITAEEVNSLLAKLGSDQEDVWRGAFEQLDYYDPRLAIDLEKLMKDVTESPVRQRLVAVLSGRTPEAMEDKNIVLRSAGPPGSGDFNFFDGRGSWWAEGKVSRINSDNWGNTRVKWTRAVRAITLLQFIDSPEAVGILKEMATGNPDAQPTVAAKAALAALGMGEK